MNMEHWWNDTDSCRMKYF